MLFVFLNPLLVIENSLQISQRDDRSKNATYILKHLLHPSRSAEDGSILLKGQDPGTKAVGR